MNKVEQIFLDFAEFLGLTAEQLSARDFTKDYKDFSEQLKIMNEQGASWDMIQGYLQNFYNRDVSGREMSGPGRAQLAIIYLRESQTMMKSYAEFYGPMAEKNMIESDIHKSSLIHKI